MSEYLRGAALRGVPWWRRAGSMMLSETLAAACICHACSFYMHL
jgi:hypothetical protein